MSVWQVEPLHLALGLSIMGNFAFLMGVLRGTLVPRKVVDDAHSDRDNWLRAYQARTDEAHEKEFQMAQLLSTTKETQMVLESMRDAAVAVRRQVES
jgi:hypothetical protein